MTNNHGAPITIVENIDIDFVSSFQAVYPPIKDCPVGTGETRETAIEDLKKKLEK